MHSNQARFWASAASAADFGLKNLRYQFFFLGSMLGCSSKQRPKKQMYLTKKMNNGVTIP
jgi:hypothetical protein